MDNRLQVLSWLMLLAMLSMMAMQSAQMNAGRPDDRPVAAVEPGFRAFPTVLAMSLDQLDSLLSTAPEK